MIALLENSDTDACRENILKLYMGNKNGPDVWWEKLYAACDAGKVVTPPI